MRRMVEVCTGEVAAGSRNTVLKSNAIGSCVVVAAIDIHAKIGGLAHIMVPGRAPERRNGHPFRYACNAIDELLRLITEKGARLKNIRTCMIGGANVLQREGDTLCRENLNSITGYLSSFRIPVVKTAVGGTERRSVEFDIDNGTIWFTVGDSGYKCLWAVEHGTKKRFT